MEIPPLRSTVRVTKVQGDMNVPLGDKSATGWLISDIGIGKRVTVDTGQKEPRGFESSPVENFIDDPHGRLIVQTVNGTRYLIEQVLEQPTEAGPDQAEPLSPEGTIPLS